MKLSAIIVLVLSLSACGGRDEKLTQLPALESAASQQVVSVHTLTVSSAPITRTVLATGTTEPVRAADLGPQVTARVEAVLVEEGDAVKVGAPLVRLDMTSASLRLRQAEANAASTENQYKLAEAEHDRLAPLAPQGTVTPQQIERLSLQRDTLKAAAEAARIAAQTTQRDIADATLRAPFAGVVSRVLVEVGEIATVTPPDVLVRLVDLSSVDVRVRVHERELARIGVGDSITATFPSNGQREGGTVTYISPEIDPRTRTGEVVTRIPNADAHLRAGMFTEIEVHPKSEGQGVIVPVTALGGTGDQRFVYVVRDGVLARRTVRSATIDADRVEILDGLTPGEVVVIADVARLSEGLKVKLVTETARAGAEK